jgi:hypothetical protein
MTANRLGIVRDAAGDYPLRHSKRERKLIESVREDKNISETFQSQPVVGAYNMATGLAVAAEPASAVLLSMKTAKADWELYFAAIETTGTAVAQVPVVDASGLLIPMDADQTDGPTAVELGHGVTARSRAAFTVGTSPEFYAEATFSFADISDLTELWFGFRKAEAYQADPDNYDEACTLAVGHAADGRINIVTILNNAATVVTNTAVTAIVDGGSVTLKVVIGANGKARFYVNDTENTAAAFTFDTGEVVVPFLHVDGETGDAGIYCSAWKVGRA